MLCFMQYSIYLKLYYATLWLFIVFDFMLAILINSTWVSEISRSSSTSLISDSCWYFMLWNFAAFFFQLHVSFLCPGYKGFWVVAKYLAKAERWHFCLSESWFIFFVKISPFVKSPVVFYTTKKLQKKLEDLLGSWFFCLLCCSMTSYSVYLC